MAASILALRPLWFRTQETPSMEKADSTRASIAAAVSRNSVKSTPVEKPILASAEEPFQLVTLESSERSEPPT